MEEIPPGTVRIVHPEGYPGIGVINVRGKYFALQNRCPHMGAPLCLGRITGTTTERSNASGGYETEWVREGEIMACPWHHWEIDIATGRTVFPSRSRVRRYEVEVDNEAPELRSEAASHGDPEAKVETYPVDVRQSTVYLQLGERQSNVGERR